jgi:NAD+ synthase (glutamine-hydrolysing)
MRLVKIGFANLDTTVGAVKSNTKKIINALTKMDGQCVTVGCFQEQVIGGYPAEDWVQWPDFVDAQWQSLQEIINYTKGRIYPAVVTLGVTMRLANNLYNCQAVISDGKLLGIVPKEKLPTYGVFYEGRTFTPGNPYEYQMEDEIPFGDLIFQFPFGTMAVEVCEDIWTPDGPMKRRAYSGAELIINASASPFEIGKDATRKEMLATRSADNQATVVYINQVGGNDSLVFDGGGHVLQIGRLLKEAPRWQEGITTQVVDLDVTTIAREKNTTWRTDQLEFLQRNQAVTTVVYDCTYNKDFHAYPKPANQNFFMPEFKPQVDQQVKYFEDLIQAMLTGLDGYYAKTKAFKGIGIALSGGKDSVLTLMVAWIYRQKIYQTARDETKCGDVTFADFIKCFSMPTRFNTADTKGISKLLCEELEVSLSELSIEEAFAREVAATKAMLGIPPASELKPITMQNIQARIRGQRMLNWANETSGMWLQTGNMSEKAVGYTTVGGDMMGAYSLISNLPKSVIILLIDYLTAKYQFKGLKQLQQTKPSAELAPNQEDEKDLMPFPILDACTYLYAGEKMNPQQMLMVLRSMWSDEEFQAMDPNFNQNLLKDWINKFITLFQRSIFKWVQTPEGVHIGSLELDFKRALQLNVVSKLEWLKILK